MKTVKIISFVIAMLMIASVICACGGEETASGGETASTVSAAPGGEGDSSESAEPESSGEGAPLSLEGYKVIKPKYSSSYAVQLQVNELITEINKRFNTEATTVTDAEEATDKEIILTGSNREGAEKLSDLEAYSVSVKNGKIYLLGGSDRATLAAVNSFKKLVASGEEIKNGYVKNGKYEEAAAGFEGTVLKYVWGDDFNGTDYDKEKWNLQGMNASDIIQEMTPRTYKVENGEIYMYSSNATAEDLKVNKDKFYYSPYFLVSKGIMEFQYGIFEINAKIPFYKGNSSAFWFCSTITSAQGYSCEIDMVELLGSENNVVSNLHTWTAGHTAFDGKIARKDRSHTFESEPEQLRQEYHTYFFNWTEDFIDFGTDSEVYYHADLTAEGASQFADPSKLDLDAFRLPVYIIISEFLYTPGRGYNNRNIDPGTEFFYMMNVDHVDIYQSEYVGNLYFK